MVHPDMRIGLYISNFLCVSTTIVIYSHLSESTPCKAPLYDIKIRSAIARGRAKQKTAYEDRGLIIQPVKEGISK